MSSSDALLQPQILVSNELSSTASVMRFSHVIPTPPFMMRLGCARICDCLLEMRRKAAVYGHDVAGYVGGGV